MQKMSLRDLNMNQFTGSNTPHIIYAILALRVLIIDDYYLLMYCSVMWIEKCSHHIYNILGPIKYCLFVYQSHRLTKTVDLLIYFV